MTESIRKITVDLARKSNTRLIYATQHDKDSRKIIIYLTDGGIPYSVPKTAIATVNFARPDGEVGAFMANVEDDGSVSITLGLWPLSAVGEVACSVSLFDGEEKRLTSSHFFLDVVSAIYSGDDITYDKNYSVLTDLISEVSGYKEVEAALKETTERANAAVDQIEEMLASGELEGKDGQDGYTPEKGIDYYTDADKAEMVKMVLAALPDGDEVSY